uniref:Zinc finger protein 292 n=1 Tax=Anas platyrhynchos TaxID=8839 RepID=A0A8B9T1M2_ANAPL
MALPKACLIQLNVCLKQMEAFCTSGGGAYSISCSLTLLEYAEKWKTSEDPLPLLEVYTVAIRSYVKARPYLTSECENVAFVLERLALSCIELLLCLPLDLPETKWEEFQAFVQVAHKNLMENGSRELHILTTLTQEKGVWKNPILCGILSQEQLDPDKVNEFLVFEGPVLLDMRIKHLMKTKQLMQATALAKLCSDHPEISAKGNFKQTYLVCLCSGSPNEKLMEEIAEVDCKDALEMICNLESDGDEKSALILCAAFLSRQLQQGEMYCAWELTLFWSKLQQRVEPSIQVYLERCRQLSVLTKTVYHIFFLIKVINSEIDGAGLATCIELCVKALRLESSENADVKISICKTISCLLPDDLEVKRACQLSEFLLEPTVDAYYAVEMLYNQPDQKYDEENLPIPNSLRCELLLVLKTQWPFDPEFWDWKTLKRQCLALMGEEASIVSSIDELNDSEVYEKVEDCQEETKETSQKKREIKKLRERGFISARFRNWQAYMQYCVLCDKEFLGHRIVRHAQKHYKDGIYSCPICAQNFNSKENFVPHVTLHVKKSSKERLAAMKPLRRLGRPPKVATANENQKTDSIVPVQKPLPVNEFTCPVTFCKKGFKYFKNLIAHAKGHKDNEEAKRFLEMQSKKVICQYCRRHFVSVTHLNDHLQMHCGSKPYICIQMKCKAGFNSYAELLTHRKEHQVFRAKCMFPKCGRVFSEAYLLYDHEAQHYNTYTCKFTGCGKVYRSQNELEKHVEDHSKQPEKVQQPEGQTNPSDLGQPCNANESTVGVAVKEDVPISKLEIEDSIKAAANLYNLPLKTLESITFIPSQPNINSSLVPAASPAAPVQKFNCQVEGCTRTYNSSQSIGKHMKAAHPDQYAAFKMQRKNKKPRKSSNLPTVANDGKIVYLMPPQAGNPSGFAVHAGNATAAKSNSAQSETSQKDDIQILEILEGLQKLKLENDSSIQVSESVSQCPPADTLAPAVPVVSTESKPLVQTASETTHIHFSDKVNKPFVCQDQGCNYSAMTKDALFKHYGKVHQYTAEMILEIKKHQLKYAPFKCVVASCPKTFTRNSNLRAHCQLVHHFTTEEMVKLKIKRPYGRRSQNETANAAPRPVEIKNVQTLIIENKTPAQSKVRKARRHRKEKEERKRRKPVAKSLEFPTRYSPYRPYRCVHQGCFAAFTIQQNLILHYQAVHKSDLPAFSAEVEEENDPGKEDREEAETKPAVREFRCEVNDCSRIFQEVPSLIQHYMKLHNMTPEEIRSMKAAPEVGRFSCDQSQCKSSFTAYFNYIVHLETEHGVKIRPNKVEDDGVFKCDCEGCDRIYATRSNLLRHIFNKHNDRHKDHLIRPRRLTGLKNRSGKESSRLSVKTKRKKNITLENKNSKGMQIQENKAYSLKRGKHVFSIKARNDALSECTSRFLTQYPCMIKGCSSVVTSESNIIRHYKCHKLSKAFTSQHRNLLIVSKKHPVSPVKETPCEQEETDKKSDVKEAEPTPLASNNDSSTSTLPQNESEKGEKDEVDELTELFITKLINEDCSSAENQRLLSLFKQLKSNLQLSTGVHLKPMGFEVSFLKFLEESAVKQKKNTERDYHGSGTKKGSHSNLRKSTEKTSSLASNNVTWSCSETETLVQFANPSQLQCSENVKIVLDKALKDCTERVLKQLQEMRPTVSLRKLDGRWENNPDVTVKRTDTLIFVNLTSSIYG